MKVEKIDHLAIMENAVKQIAQRPTQDRRYGHYSQTARLLSMPEEQDQREELERLKHKPSKDEDEY